MSELAGLEQLQAAKRRRHDSYDVSGLGRVRLQSITPSENIRVEGLRSRAVLAFSEDKTKKGNAFLSQADALFVALHWVDANNARLIGDDNYQSAFDDVDQSVFGELIKVCREHSGLTGGEVDEEAKN